MVVSVTFRAHQKQAMSLTMSDDSEVEFDEDVDGRMVLKGVQQSNIVADVGRDDIESPEDSIREMLVVETNANLANTETGEDEGSAVGVGWADSQEGKDMAGERSVDVEKEERVGHSVKKELPMPVAGCVICYCLSPPRLMGDHITDLNERLMSSPQILVHVHRRRLKNPRYPRKMANY